MLCTRLQVKAISHHPNDVQWLRRR